MGYYTAFILEDVYSSVYPEAWAIIVKALKETHRYDLNLEGNETYKWYSWKEDCLKISASNPDIAFKISGQGEETGDTWWADFYQGQMTDYWKKPNESLKLSNKTLAKINK